MDVIIRWKRDYKIIVFVTLDFFTDTYSSVYKIEMNDAYEDFYMNNDTFVFSEYREHWKFHNVKNKKVIVKMKDEIKGVQIVCFVEWRSKMYSFIKEDTGECKWEYCHKNKIMKNIKTHFLKNK